MKFFIALLACAEAAKDAHLSGAKPSRPELVEVEASQDACYDMDWADSYGDACDWYYGMEEWCGDYDEGTGGSAWDSCCACGGGCPSVWVDSFGDGCDWYDANPDGCGYYDTDCGSAWDMCGACA